jgi:hypothetical protein
MRHFLFTLRTSDESLQRVEFTRKVTRRTEPIIMPDRSIDQIAKSLNRARMRIMELGAKHLIPVVYVHETSTWVGGFFKKHEKGPPSILYGVILTGIKSESGEGTHYEISTDGHPHIYDYMKSPRAVRVTLDELAGVANPALTIYRPGGKMSDRYGKFGTFETNNSRTMHACLLHEAA